MSMDKRHIKIFLSILFFVLLVMGFVARILQGNTHKEWLNGFLGVLAGLNAITLAAILLIDVPDRLRDRKPLSILGAVFYLFLGVVLIGIFLISSYQGIDELVRTVL